MTGSSDVALLLDKIILLERCVGAQTGYQVLDPFPLNPRAVLDLQEAAKKIAKHVGLGNLTFCVAEAKQEEHVGGQIELQHQQEVVFIEISEKVMKFQDAVLATLAHEISHKYLSEHGIASGSGHTGDRENEVLTDVTAVFLGLGKLMLNGCECTDVLMQGDQTVTETLRSGYLDGLQLAFVYRLVSAMRGIAWEKYQGGLLPRARFVLQQCEKEYGDYFDERFHGANVRKEILEPLRARVADLQSVLWNLEKASVYLRVAVLEQADQLLDETHKRCARVLFDLEGMTKENEIDPALRFLAALQLEQRVTTLLSELQERKERASDRHSKLARITGIVARAGKPFPEPSAEMFTVINCRNDGTKLRLPVGKARMQVRCPKCRYEFVVETRELLCGRSIFSVGWLDLKKQVGRISRIRNTGGGPNRTA